MEENTLEVTRRNFTIEDLHRKKAEKEQLLEKNDKEIIPAVMKKVVKEETEKI